MTLPLQLSAQDCESFLSAAQAQSWMDGCGRKDNIRTQISPALSPPLAPSPATTTSTRCIEEDEGSWNDNEDDGWDVDDFLDMWEKEKKCIEHDDGWSCQEKCVAFRMEGPDWFVSDEHLRLSLSIANVMRATNTHRPSNKRDRSTVPREEAPEKRGDAESAAPSAPSTCPQPAVFASIYFDEEEERPHKRSRHARASKTPASSKSSSAVPRTKKRPAQSERFRTFLAEEEDKGVISIHCGEDGGGEEGSPIQIAGWDVLDRSAWWEDVKFWFEDDPGSWTESAFFMVLRRVGFRALNDAGPPASLGHDFALKRTDVLRHGYVFKVDVLERYNKLLHRKLGLPSTKIVTPDAEASASAHWQADKARSEGNLKAQLRAQESQWHQRASSDKPEEESHEDGDPDATDTQPAPDTPPAPPLLPCSSSSSASSSLCGSQPGTPSLCQ